MARLRPIDMTLPIWPCARRCIQTKKPMINITGSSRPANWRNQFVDGVMNWYSTPRELMSSSSASESPRSPPPVETNDSPVVNSPVIRPDTLLISMEATSPAVTRSMNSEYDSSDPAGPDVRLGMTTAARNTPAATQGSHRRHWGFGEPGSPGEFC